MDKDNLVRRISTTLGLCLLTLCLVVAPGYAGEMSSASYAVSSDMFSGGGGKALSTGFRMQSGLAANVGFPDESVGTLYAVSPGFWQTLIRFGDVNRDGVADLTDVIRGLQVMTGESGGVLYRQADINGDGKIGLDEILFSLEKAAGQR